MGSAYFLIVRRPIASEDTEPPPDLLGKGSYHDQLVKTPEGWRFKNRTITWGTFPDELLQALAQ